MTLRQMMVATGCIALILVVRPVCPIYATFHVLCPGCGGTRALLALLRGDLGTAWRMNALLVGALPLLAGYVAVTCYRAMQRKSSVWPEIPTVALSLCLAVTALFTVARNL